MPAYHVRPATAEDAAAICEIYNQGIEDRLATLETELRTPQERREWLSARSPRHPVIVAETEPARSTVHVDGGAQPVTYRRDPVGSAVASATAEMVGAGPRRARSEEGANG